ncbi:hypothetical protein [Gracilimonas sediminicola]|uniref:hypothetical protein n=1 Tax=Gracilimonas sediminicola TaxID=2952158 RepID=UPI0038D3EC38
MMTIEKFLLYFLPWILLLGWTIYSLYILTFRNKSDGFSSYHVIQHIPSTFVTLGVLGTFAGVSLGLLKFDLSPDQISTSISGLLEGLKNAFYTSLYGLFFSVFTSIVIRYQYSKNSLKDPEIAEEQDLLKELKKSIDNFGQNLAEYNSAAIMSSLKQVIKDFNDTFSNLIGDLVTENFEELSSSVDQLIEWQLEYREGVNELLESNRVLNDRSNKVLQSYNQIHNNMDRLTDSATNLKNTLINLRNSIEDESSLSGLISQLELSTKNLADISNDASVFKDEIEKMSNNLIDTQKEVQGWLSKENGVLDATTSLNHTLKELRQFDIAQIEQLDKSFTNRLGTTFANLDKLMKSYIQYLEDKPRG